MKKLILSMALVLGVGSAIEATALTPPTGMSIGITTNISPGTGLQNRIRQLEMKRDISSPGSPSGLTPAEQLELSRLYTERGAGQVVQ